MFFKETSFGLERFLKQHNEKKTIKIANKCKSLFRFSSKVFFFIDKIYVINKNKNFRNGNCIRQRNSEIQTKI